MLVSNLLKNFLPMELMFKIKYRHLYSHPKELKKANNKRIYYLDAPDYSNLGDQAIAYAIKKFSEKYFPEYEFIEILQKDVASYIKWLKLNMNNEDIIFLTGGGNMGNYYRIYEATRRIVIKNFHNNRIVVFPQSLMYSENIWGHFSINKSQRIYNSNDNLIVLAREEDSYFKMINLYKNVFLCPDIVLSLVGRVKIQSNERNDHIGLCLRNDIEQKLTIKDHSFIMKICEQYTSEVKEITTISDIEEITESNRAKIINSKISEIASCKVLITDRLHALIFSAVSYTPCIVFQNNNSKIKGTLSWLQRFQHIQLVEQPEELEQILPKVVSAPCISTDVFDFSSIANIIRGSLNG